LLKAISGLLKPKQGDIVYLGQSIAGKAAQAIVKQGISHVPEGRRVFANMTVEENLELGAFLRNDKDGIRQDFEKVYELFPRLLERRKQLSGTLSGGEQQMLAMGRALMARPKLLLLDEPSMGLAPLLVKTIFRIIEEINQAGTTILLVEQNANMALSIASRAYVIETGRVVLSGTAEELNASDQVKMAYLGGH
jgi:branched-chain amino acid transport system ATP-binding protein